MKKSYLFGAIGALLLASCANDDLIVKPDAPTTGEAKQMPIELSMTTGNISRDAGLNTMYYDFGVYAYKANDQDDLRTVTTTTVMSDYMVGFWDSPNGNEYVAYMPQDLNKIINPGTTHTAWYYNGLGSAEAASTYTWGANTKFTGYQGAAHTSRNPYQYVKYWDGAKTNTYFYGYAPYDCNITVTPAYDKTTMTFPAISSAYSPIYLYAFQKEVNANHLDDNNETVPMQFKRLLSEIRLAFYEEVPGYDVYLLDYNATNKGIYAVPADKNDATTPATYSRGEFLAKAQPIVTIVDGATTPVTVDYNLTGDGYDTGNIVCPIEYFSADGFQNFTTKLGESRATKIVGPSKGVLPITVTSSSKGNSGFTLNVSFKFVAKDTKEEIIVHNARVYVPASDTQWEANKLYTYIFRITNNVPGTTVPPATDPDPEVKPTNQALYPIVFESVTVTDITEEEKGPYNVN